VRLWFTINALISSIRICHGAEADDPPLNARRPMVCRI
jgi:hypothetical protein